LERNELDAGQYIDFIANSAFSLEASAPVLVVSYLRSNQVEGSGNGGDPAMVLIAPRNAWRDRFVTHNPEGWLEERAVVVAPLGAEILLDGAPVEEIQEIAQTGFIQVSAALDPGTHTLESDMPIYVISYGQGRFASYAAPGR